MRLPEVATRLRELAIQLGCEELSELADEIARRPSAQRAPKTSAPMTESLRAQIRAMKTAEPDLSHAEIGRRLNPNPSRVSETLGGKRSREFKAVIGTSTAASMPISASPKRLQASCTPRQDIFQNSFGRRQRETAQLSDRFEMPGSRLLHRIS
jgi:hypothetical protein